jgi:O-antigen/teichoic acid export membrane protein
MGLEYPLLKKSMAHRQRIFGTVMLIELAITVASIPVIIFATGSLYQESVEFTWIAIGILVFSSVGFVGRFALLGLSMSRTILIIDVVATAIKFGSVIGFVSMGYGSLGILLSFLIHAAVTTISTVIIASKLFGLSTGNLSFTKATLKDGLVNTPSKLSGALIISLSVVLLASLGVDSSEVGVFYIAMMFSIVVGSFASSLAFMSIPASSALSKDLSTGSLRVGLVFSAPIVAALIASPNYVLSMIGSSYAEAGEILVILAMGVLPSAILANATSRFNNQNMPRKLLTIGVVRLGVFLISFFVLVPPFSSLGAAYAILISVSTSAILSIVWTEKAAIRFIGFAILSIVGATIASQAMSLVPQAPPILLMGTSIGTALLIMFISKCSSVKEIAEIIISLRKVRTN